MRRITAIICSSSLMLAVFGFMPVLHAANYDPTKVACTGKAASSEICNQSSDNPLTGSNGLIIKAAQIVVIFTTVIAVIMIILGGYTYITSTGDAHKIKAAKDTILFALVGLVVAGLGQAMVSFVLSKL